MLVIGVVQLIRILKEYISNFNPAQAHQEIAQRILTPIVSPIGESKAGKVIAFPILNGCITIIVALLAYASVGQKSWRMKGVG